MGMSRLTLLAAGGFMTLAFAASASAVSSEAECKANGGDVMDLKGAKHCLVPLIPEEYRSEDYAELQGVRECEGTVRKTSIGDYCLVALEPIPAKEEAVTQSPEINDSLARDTAAAEDAVEQ